MENFIFENIDVWQKSRMLVKAVYQLVNNLPNQERFALSDQIRRAIVSVPSNIAEGSGRTSPKEKIHFLEIANGSLLECYCQLMIAVDLGYFKEDEILKLRPKFLEISKMINGWRNNLKNKI